MSLSKILGNIDIELKEREKAKNELYDSMRKAIRLSKQAIFLMHREQFVEAKKALSETVRLFRILEDISTNHQELLHAGIVHAAFQEYSEAQILLSLLRETRFVEPAEIHVPSTSYLLGLADVVGELRRTALDSLRKGDVKTAERNLKTMDDIYREIIALDGAMHFVSELRRKADVARRIIEITRGDVTIEVRRSSLEHSIKKLHNVMKTE